jgi:transcriptional regulator with XRE-family HTH domain
MPMNPWDRKAELVRRRVKQSEIARQLGFSRAYVSDVIAGNRRSERVEAAVAEAIGRDVDKVFPPREQAAA